MLVEKIEHKWLAAFARTFGLCKVQPGEVVAILSETQSRRVNVELARLALEGMGAKVFEVTLTTPALTAPAPVRSTGASDAIQQLAPVVSALARVGMVVDCTVEGLLHAPELPTIMKGVDGHMPRLLMVSNEHPEILERTVPDPATESVVRAAMKRLRAAQQMHVTSAAGTDHKPWSVASGAMPTSRAWSRTGPAVWRWPSRPRAASAAPWSWPPAM